jgi:beta-glucosidase
VFNLSKIKKLLFFYEPDPAGFEGAGVADFLFAANGFIPVGKLPTSWPDQYEDLPLAQDGYNALYPFGFGLDKY